MNLDVGKLRMLINKSEHSIADLALALSLKTLRIYQR